MDLKLNLQGSRPPSARRPQSRINPITVSIQPPSAISAGLQGWQWLTEMLTLVQVSRFAQMFLYITVSIAFTSTPLPIKCPPGARGVF